MKRLSLALLACCSITTPAALAENEIRAGAGLDASPFSNRNLGLGLDIGSRYRMDGGDLVRIELRPGISYKVSERIGIAGGYYWGSTRQPGPDRIEHRLWQDANYDIGHGAGLQFAGRTRAEQRWRDGWNDTGTRIRQRLSATYPIARTRLSLEGSSEAFFELSDTDWGAHSGLGEWRNQIVVEWELSGRLSVEAGYLNVFENEQSGPDETDHHIVISLARSF